MNIKTIKEKICENYSKYIREGQGKRKLVSRRQYLKEYWKEFWGGRYKFRIET